jgi:phage terminase large subunit
MAAEPRWLIVPAGFFNACYARHLTAPQRYQIFFGGAGSGKSVFVASRVVLDAMCGRSTLVVRQVARALRASCLNEVVKAAGRLGLAGFFALNRTDMTYTCQVSGAQVLFAGLDDVEKVKSITPAKGVLTDVWVEEATETAWADVKQLEKRLRGISRHPKRMTLTFNPVSRGHWIYGEFFAGFADDQRELVTDRLLILRTTYRDNRFLTADDRAAIEGERDGYFRSVYTLGEWGDTGSAIFTAWRAEDLSALRKRADCLRCGLDFGYAGDPAAAVLAHYDRRNKRLYILDELYLRGLSNDGLAARLKAFAGGCPVVCDSAEPKSIAELRRLGVRAHPARKGPDSVLHGIQWLRQHEMVVDARLTHIKEELANYRWRKDSRGQAMPIPEPGQDHLIDALRYAMEGDSQGRQAKFN